MEPIDTPMNELQASIKNNDLTQTNAKIIKESEKPLKDISIDISVHPQNSQVIAKKVIPIRDNKKLKK